MRMLHAFVCYHDGVMCHASSTGLIVQGGKTCDRLNTNLSVQIVEDCEFGDAEKSRTIELLKHAIAQQLTTS